MNNMKYILKSFNLSFFVLFALLLLSSGCAVMSGYHSGISCNTCHDGSASLQNTALKSPDKPSLLCKECHFYEVDSDHHPTSMKPGILGASAVISESFKLYNNKMECLTCHVMHRNEGDLSRERYFLVGGPYAKRKDICKSCHQSNKYINVNPHSNYADIGNESRDKFTGKECLVCHYPSNGKSYSQDPSLRASDAFMCWKCHKVMQGDFLSRHYLLKEISEDEDMTYEGLEAEADPNLHLDPFGRITCSTCHDPHRPYDANKKERTSGRIPMRSKKICSNCHSN